MRILREVRSAAFAPPLYCTYTFGPVCHALILICIGVVELGVITGVIGVVTGAVSPGAGVAGDIVCRHPVHAMTSIMSRIRNRDFIVGNLKSERINVVNTGSISPVFYRPACITSRNIRDLSYVHQNLQGGSDRITGTSGRFKERDT